MIYASTGVARYKSAMQSKSTRPYDTFSAQTPLMIIGLAAISMILLINSHARPTSPREEVVAYACADCGTVVAVRRTEQSAPAYLVDVQMLDGSIRTVALSSSYNVGDVVRLNGTR